MVAHSPDVAVKLSRRTTLLLAGHTHCGQVVLPLIGAPVEVTNPRYRCGICARSASADGGDGRAGHEQSADPLRRNRPTCGWCASGRSPPADAPGTGNVPSPRIGSGATEKPGSALAAGFEQEPGALSSGLVGPVVDDAAGRIVLGRFGRRPSPRGSFRPASDCPRAVRPASRRASTKSLSLSAIVWRRLMSPIERSVTLPVLPHAFGDRVGHAQDLRGLIIEQQVIVAGNAGR